MTDFNPEKKDPDLLTVSIQNQAALNWILETQKLQAEDIKEQSRDMKDIKTSINELSLIAQQQQGLSKELIEVRTDLKSTQADIESLKQWRAVWAIICSTIGAITGVAVTLVVQMAKGH